MSSALKQVRAVAIVYAFLGALATAAAIALTRDHWPAMSDALTYREFVRGAAIAIAVSTGVVGFWALAWLSLRYLSS